MSSGLCTLLYNRTGKLMFSSFALILASATSACYLPIAPTIFHQEITARLLLDSSAGLQYVSSHEKKQKRIWRQVNKVTKISPRSDMQVYHESRATEWAAAAAAASRVPSPGEVAQVASVTLHHDGHHTQPPVQPLNPTPLQLEAQVHMQSRSIC